MQRRLVWLFALGLVTASCTGVGEVDGAASPDVAPTTTEGVSQDDPVTPPPSFAGTTPAPEFPPGLDWLNTEAPLTIGGLRGKAVLLDFWTYGCINCIHIIPDLKRLETEYADELVVIGVHSAKFLNEGETDNIRQVVLRYELAHPVVNDRDFEVWRTWGVDAWPTVALIDPAGNVVGIHAGEGVYRAVQPILEGLIAEFDEQGLVDRAPITFAPESGGSANTLLSFPGKVLADPERELIYIADSGNHRIVAADPATGEVKAVYGSGREGADDGDALRATFSSPQGMALGPGGDVLYVADTNNHTIREIDLATGVVATFAGTGRLGWPPSTGALAETALNSPWDLALRDGLLYIAMAGTHQLWAADLDAATIGPVVGNTLESVVNGSLANAELAQPSGLAFDAAGRLYFADSESSSIRYADVGAADGRTGLVSGSDQNLFDFGDEDGVGSQARLQHPLGVAYWEAQNALLIADTYNSKIKRIDLDGYQTTTFLGNDQGWEDGTSARFHEPGGIDINGETLYIADTNNHVVRIVDLATANTTTLVLSGVERFSPPPDSADYRGIVVALEAQTVAAGSGVIELAIALPEGYKVNEQAPSTITWSVEGDAAHLNPDANRSLTGTTLPVTFDATFSPGTAEVVADVNLIYCRDDAESLCFIEQLRFVAPVTVADSGAALLTLPFEVALPSL